jgi:1-acyl-sn-glycerol-3-phosphate acyltransferase
MVSNFIVSFFQVLVYPFMHFYFKYILKIKIQLDFQIDKKGSYIFTPNHVSKLDPFMIFYSMKFREMRKCHPTRFLTSKSYMQSRSKSFFMKLIGCYSTEYEPIKNSIYFLENGNNLCIFIEGKLINNSKKHEKPKVGAVYINRDVKKSYLVPVKIIAKNNLAEKIVVKDKFRFKKYPKDLHILTDKLLEKIYE